jgi:uncharacterized protein YkwD
MRQFIILITLCLSLLQVTHAQPTQNDADIERGVLIHITQYRHAHGLPPLTMDERISKQARQHSKDMAQHAMPFGHQQFKTRINTLYKQFKNVNGGAENVAYNYKDAQTVVANWVTSPGHKRNIVGQYNLTGIGIAKDSKGKIYYTQMFLRIGTQNIKRVWL